MLKEDIEPESLWYNSPHKKGINKCNIHLDSGVTIRCKYVKNWIVKVFFDIIILIVSHILSNICPKTTVMRIKDSSLGNKIVVFRNATIYIVICYPSPISFNHPIHVALAVNSIYHVQKDIKMRFHVYICNIFMYYILVSYNIMIFAVFHIEELTCNHSSIICVQEFETYLGTSKPSFIFPKHGNVCCQNS